MIGKNSKKIHTSFRGETVDMAKLTAANEKTIALTGRTSFVKMNARGDILGDGGRVEIRREQIEQRYNKNPENSVKNVGIKSLIPDSFETPSEAIDRLTAEVKKLDKKEVKKETKATVDTPTNVISKERARKLIDSDD